MEGEKKGIFWIVDRENLQSNEPYLFCIPVDRMGAPIAGAPMRNTSPRRFAAASRTTFIRAAG